MGRKNTSKKKKKQKAGQQRPTVEQRPKQDDNAPDSAIQFVLDAPWNFSLDAGPGCHIARPPLSAQSAEKKACSAWVLEWESVNRDDYVEDVDNDAESLSSNANLPDLAVDPYEKTLTLCNVRDRHVVAYITVYGHRLKGKDGKLLQQGITTTDKTTTDQASETKSCTTLIVLCPPCTFCHLCYIVDDEMSAGSGSDDPAQAFLESLHLDSDVQEWNRHDNPYDSYGDDARGGTAFKLLFPLQCYTEDTPTNAQDVSPTPHRPLAFRCTQGIGGQLTHFFAGNLHAYDFACPVGTPLVASADGVVVNAVDRHNLSGIAVSNLFTWNSILIQVDTNPVDGDDKGSDRDIHPLFIEYVHIQTSLVKPGDLVKRGQVIGTSGSVGFSPEPHLHFAAYRSADPTAPTVQISFFAQEEKLKKDEVTSRDSLRSRWIVPVAGRWYNVHGEQAPQGS